MNQDARERLMSSGAYDFTTLYQDVESKLEKLQTKNNVLQQNIDIESNKQDFYKLIKQQQEELQEFIQEIKFQMAQLERCAKGIDGKNKVKRLKDIYLKEIQRNQIISRSINARSSFHSDRQSESSIPIIKSDSDKKLQEQKQQQQQQQQQQQHQQQQQQIENLQRIAEIHRDLQTVPNSHVQQNSNTDDLGDSEYVNSYGYSKKPNNNQVSDDTMELKIVNEEFQQQDEPDINEKCVKYIIGLVGLIVLVGMIIGVIFYEEYL